MGEWESSGEKADDLISLYRLSTPGLCALIKKASNQPEIIDCSMNGLVRWKFIFEQVYRVIGLLIYFVLTDERQVVRRG